MPEKFVPVRPEDGTPTLGAVFYILHEKEIVEATGREPIGYVVVEDVKAQEG